MGSGALGRGASSGVAVSGEVGREVARASGDSQEGEFLCQPEAQTSGGDYQARPRLAASSAGRSATFTVASLTDAGLISARRLSMND